MDFRTELAKWGYNKGNAIDVEILVNEILPSLFFLKEEPKQETLEEAAERNYKEAGVNAYFNNGFIRGAKWQQEQDKNKFSEEQLKASLQNIELINPADLQMTSNGHGEFPDGYKLTEKGIQYIIEQFKKK